VKSLGVPAPFSGPEPLCFPDPDLAVSFKMGFGHLEAATKPGPGVLGPLGPAGTGKQRWSINGLCL
jgi:hypothetical protein